MHTTPTTLSKIMAMNQVKGRALVHASSDGNPLIRRRDLTNQLSKVSQQPLSLEGLGSGAQATIDYVTDVTSVVRNFSDDASIGIIQSSRNVQENATSNSFLELIDSLKQAIPEEARIPILISGAILLVWMAYKASFIYIVLVIASFIVILFILNSISVSKQEGARVELEGQKYSLARSNQIFTTSLSSHVQDQAKDIHSMHLQTLLDQEKVVAKARRKQLSDLEEIHGKEITKEVDMVNILETGSSKRNALRNESKLRGVQASVKTNIDIALGQAETQDRVNGEESRMSSHIRGNDTLIANIRNSTAMKVTQLKSDHEVSKAERNAERQVNQVRVEARAKIQAERQRTEEYRRQSGM